MQRPDKFLPEPATEHTPVDENACPDLLAESYRTLPIELIYDLRQPNGSSDSFYSDVSLFSDELLAEIDRRAQATILAYSRFTEDQQRETPRSRGEYGVEFLTLGFALSQYAGAAESTPHWVVRLAQTFFFLRRKSPGIKPATDLLRSALTRIFFMPRIGRKPTTRQTSLDRLPGLIAWLRATGEFEQEAVRLSNWQSFLATLPRGEAEHSITAAEELFHWFAREAERALGSYTRGVPAFLTGPYASRGCREDQIFCGRPPVEYHLSMVAAEIMNQGLRDNFKLKPHRAVLVPTCMRGTHASACRAHASGIDLVCTACDPACTVNQITRRMRVLGAKVYLIPHSTGFSRWLERWQRMPDHGVVAVACMLNILPGGFEMRARGIASQCVPLDYPGCQKHWSTSGIPTSVNQNRLAQLVQLQPQPARPPAL